MLVMTLMIAAAPNGPMWKSWLPIASSAARCRSGILVAAGKHGDLAARCEMDPASDRAFERAHVLLGGDQHAKPRISSRPSVDISIRSSRA